MDALYSYLTRPLGIIALLAVGLSGIWWLARRHERERIRKGEWDAKGPLETSEPPPSMTKGYGMEERREVIGEWQGERQRRQPGE